MEGFSAEHVAAKRPVHSIAYGDIDFIFFWWSIAKTCGRVVLQDEVSAGTVNYNGTMTLEARRAGGDTVMSDIVRMVEDAQTREAPVQRLADKVNIPFIC